MSETEEEDKSWDSCKLISIRVDLTKRNVFIFFGISRHKISKEREWLFQFQNTFGLRERWKEGLHLQTSVVCVKNPSTKSKMCESVSKVHAIQREKLSSIPRTHMKIKGHSAPVLGKQRKVGPLGLTGQPRLISESE